MQVPFLLAHVCGMLDISFSIRNVAFEVLALMLEAMADSGVLRDAHDAYPGTPKLSQAAWKAIITQDKVNALRLQLCMPPMVVWCAKRSTLQHMSWQYSPGLQHKQPSAAAETHRRPAGPMQSSQWLSQSCGAETIRLILPPWF